MVRCSGSTMAVKKEPHQRLFCKHLWWIQKLPSLDLFLVALQWKHISSQKAETAELNRISDVLNNLREHSFQLWPEAGPIAASIIQWGCSSVHFQKNASCYCMPATKHRTWTVLSTNKSLWTCRFWISTKAAVRQMIVFFSYSVVKHILWTFISHPEWV